MMTFALQLISLPTPENLKAFVDYLEKHENAEATIPAPMQRLLSAALTRIELPQTRSGPR
jgi:hypothetical protein